jgi:hypothetical protein
MAQATASLHNAGVYEHRGNGEHPQSLERRRQLLVWRWLGVLIVFGAVVGALRLVLGLLEGQSGRFVAYQVGLLALNLLAGVLVVVRLRSLRRR